MSDRFDRHHAGRGPAATWANLVRETSRVSRDQLNVPGAIRCTVGVVIPLVIGLLAGSVADGLAGAVGALCAGFASFQGSYRTRAATVLLVGGGMAVATVVGALAEGSLPATVVVDAAWGALAGILVAFGPAALVVGLQWGVGLLIASAIPMNAGQAMVRGAIILAGALIQIVLVVIVWPLRSYPAERKALTAVCASIASYARDVAGGASLSTSATTIDEARRVLRDPQPFGRAAQLVAFQALLDEGARIRITIARLARLRSLLVGGPCEVQTIRLVEGVAVAMDGVAMSLAHERPPVVLALRSSPPTPAGADLAGVTSLVDDLVDGTSAVEPAWVGDELRHTALALGGQIRSAARIAAAAAGEHDSGSDAADSPGARRPGLSRDRVISSVRSDYLRVRETVAESAVTLRANLSWSSSAFRHAVRLAVTLALCALVAHIGDVARGYWVGMTALVVLRPDFLTTATRGISRIVGTLIGAVVGTFLVAALRPGTAVLTALFATSILLAYLVVRANYALFSICVTAYVVFLLSFAQLPAYATVTDRIVDTLLGGGIAICAYLLWPTWESRLVGDRLAALAGALADYTDAVLAVHIDPRDSHRSRLDDLRSAARLARSNAETSVERMIVEPLRSRRDALPVETAEGVLAGLRRLALATLTLHAHLPTEREEGASSLASLAAAIHTDLAHAALSLRPLAEHPGASGPFVDLRTLHAELSSSARRAGGALTTESATGAVPRALILSETDLMVDSINTINELITAAALS